MHIHTSGVTKLPAGASSCTGRNTKTQTHLKGQLLTAKKPHSRDGEFVVLAKDEHGGKRVLVQLVNSLEHPTDQIGSHETHLQIVVVLVVCLPQAPSFLVKIFPEVGNGLFYNILVAVRTLECI